MLYAIVAVIALILDQLIKYWTTISVIKDEGIVKLIPGVIHLTNVHNTGAAFSFLQGARWFFVALCVVFVVMVIYFLVKNVISTPGARWCAVIVMAGAVGNAIDRVINGYVVDMFEFDFKIFGMNFPVFNLADLYLTIGVLVFCIFLLVEKPEEAQGKAKAGTTGRDASVHRQGAANTAKPASARANGEVVRFVPPASKTQTQTRTQVRAQTQVQAQAQAKAKPPERTARPASTDGPVTYSQPAGTVARPPAVKMPEAESVPVKADTPVKKPVIPAAFLERAEGAGNKTDQVMRVLVNGAPAAQTPVSQPAAPPQPVPGAPSAIEKEESYDLDDILAEFRDL